MKYPGIGENQELKSGLNLAKTPSWRFMCCQDGLFLNRQIAQEIEGLLSKKIKMGVNKKIFGNKQFQIFLSLATFWLLLNGLACKDPTQTRSYPVDLTTTATPNGKKLNPAEIGPVRSALGEPKIDLATFQLTISGLVDSGFALSWQEIQQRPAILSDTILMYCVEGWEVWGNWKGILVKDLLHQANLKPGASHVLFRCAEGYSTALPIAYLEKYHGMLAYEVNGKFLTTHDGFPLRLIAFGKYGYKWAKWVTELEVIPATMEGFWEARGYTDRADVPLPRREFYERPIVEPLLY